jgi:hypothetical protein
MVEILERIGALRSGLGGWQHGQRFDQSHVQGAYLMAVSAKKRVKLFVCQCFRYCNDLANSAVCCVHATVLMTAGNKDELG